MDAEELVAVQIGDWIVTGDGHMDLYGPVEKVTARQVRAPIPTWNRVSTRWRAEVIFAGPEDRARRLHDKLKSMRGDHERRMADAGVRHRAAVAKAAKEAMDGR